MSELRFSIKKGDRKPALQVKVFNPDGSARDLSSGIASMKFYMGKPGAAVKVNGAAMTAVTLVSGVIEYQWAAGDTDEVGEFRGEVLITDTAGKEETFPKDTYIIVEIMEDIP